MRTHRFIYDSGPRFEGVGSGATGHPDIQEVLVNGNVASGTLPIVFNDGAGNFAVWDQSALIIDDPSGNEVSVQSTTIQVVDLLGNMIFEGQAGGRIYQQGVSNEQGEIFRTVANGIAANITQEYTDGTGSGNYQVWTYNGGNPLSRQTIFNWPDLGGTFDVAVASQSMVIGNTIGGAAINNAGLYSDNAHRLANNTRYTNDGLNIGMAHLLGTNTGISIVAGAGAGGVGVSVSVTGNDLACIVTVMPGAAPAGSAQVAQLTFANVFPAAPVVVMQAANKATVLLAGSGAVVDPANTTTGTFDITSAAVALVAGVTYKWVCHIIG